MEKYFADYDYKDCLKPTDPEYLRAVKRGKFDAYTADALAVEVNKWMLKFRENWMNKLGRPDRNEKVDKELDELYPSYVRNPRDEYDEYLYEMQRDKEIMGW